MFFPRKLVALLGLSAKRNYENETEAGNEITIAIRTFIKKTVWQKLKLFESNIYIPPAIYGIFDLMIFIKLLCQIVCYVDWNL